MAGPQPTFAEIAEALLDLGRHDSRLIEIAETFMAGLPTSALGVIDAHARWREQMARVAEGSKLFADMAPREAEHRALLEGSATSHGHI